MGIGDSVETALRIESRGITKLVATPGAKNLIRTFFSSQYLTKCATDRARLVAQPAARAAVIGAGIMGGGIAYQSAFTGTPAIMKDICLLYTSDAADERSSVDLGGRRIIKKK